MSYGRYLMHDWFTAEALDDIDYRIKAIRQSDLRAKKTLARHVLALENDVAHLALVLRAVGDLLLEKGLVTEAELESKISAADLLDGSADRRLSPKLAKAGSKAPPAPAPAPAAPARKTRRPPRPMVRRRV